MFATSAPSAACSTRRRTRRVHPGPGAAGDETIIEKRCPARSRHQLHETLQDLGHLDLIVCGFMSHSSVSTTVRRAKNLGFRCTLVEDACATRDLAFKGGVIPAAQCSSAKWRSWPTTSPASP
jgi:nicotinamidase-related amidase